MPIPVPEDDPDFPYNRCLMFVRNMEVPPLDCDIGNNNDTAKFIARLHLFVNILELSLIIIVLILNEPLIVN